MGIPDKAAARIMGRPWEEEGGSKQPPLFIPLKREYYEAFVAGTKTEEFRPYGPRWNERTCTIGREVVLSLGYGKQNRTRGRIVSFRKSMEPTRSDAWQACYGEKHKGKPAACVGVRCIKNTPLA